MSIKPRGKRKVLSVFLVIVMMLSMCCVGCNGENEKENTIEQEMLSNEAVESIVFPHVVDDGKLEITSLFQYTGINPDFNQEMCENVGAIQLTNHSSEYLESADIVVALEDETVLNFRIEDVPMNMNVMAFDINNNSYVEQDVVSVEVTTTYSNNSSVGEDVFDFVTNESGFEVYNKSTDAYENILIKYHCNVDDVYFGGKAGEVLVDKLAVGERKQFEIEDCYFGEATVVNVIH